jgi:hypothetical protein
MEFDGHALLGRRKERLPRGASIRLFVVYTNRSILIILLL